MSYKLGAQKLFFVRYISYANTIFVRCNGELVPYNIDALVGKIDISTLVMPYNMDALVGKYRCLDIGYFTCSGIYKLQGICLVGKYYFSVCSTVEL